MDARLDNAPVLVPQPASRSDPNAAYVLASSTAQNAACDNFPLSSVCCVRLLCSSFNDFPLQKVLVTPPGAACSQLLSQGICVTLTTSYFAFSMLTLPVLDIHIYIYIYRYVFIAAYVCICEHRLSAALII